MNFIKRALLSVWKHKIKSLILLCVFFAIITLILVGICIPTASQKNIAMAKKNIGAEVTVYFNQDKYTPDTYKPLPQNVLNKLANIKSVQRHNYMVLKDDNISSVGFKMIVEDKYIDMDKEAIRNHYKRKGDTYLAEHALPHDIRLIGTVNSSDTDQFVSGGYKIVSGRGINSGDAGNKVIMISKVVADKNGLKTGDKITIAPSEKPLGGYKFTIIGIFSVPPKWYPPIAYGYDPVNSMLTTYQAVGLFDSDTNYKEYDISNGVYTAMYFLKDPADVPSFIAQAKSIINSDNYLISGNNDLYQKAIVSFSGLNKTAKLMSWIILFAGCLIICLIIKISLKERDFEFGVLLAIGEKKLKIIGQMLIEVVITVCIAFCFAVAAGNFAADRIGNTMLSNEVKTQLQSHNVTDNIGDRTYYQGKSLRASPIDSMKISIEPSDIGSLAGISLAIVLVSVLIPCSSVLRYNPKILLSKRK